MTGVMSNDPRRFYLTDNVFDAALGRVRWLFDEFPNIYVAFSGGKDSTVCLNLALQVAEEKGRLPLKVLFIDQEAEWQTVIDYVRQVMADPRVEARWLQVPIRLFNATSVTDSWLHCWEEGKTWMRDKEPDSIHENTFGTDRFGGMFIQTLKTWHPDEPAIIIGGVRTEESPGRLLGLTSSETYKGETWGRVNTRALDQFTFYPIYDWGFTDVWKAIHTNGWPYCPLYDQMYRYGIPVREMRVSNVHHETATRSLYFLQEFEAATWNKLTARLAGISTAGQLQDQFERPRELPWMFSDWKEYRDYLLENLITDPEAQASFRKQFGFTENRFHVSLHESLWKAEVACILVNDYHGTKLRAWENRNGVLNKGLGYEPGRKNKIVIR